MADPNEPWFSEEEVAILCGALREYRWDIPQRDELIRKIDLLGKRKRYRPGDPEYATPLQIELLEERKKQAQLAEKEKRVRADRKAGKLIARA